MEDSLFTYADKYPAAAGYAKGSDTSKEAAVRLTTKKALHEIILGVLAVSPAGMTVDEMKPIVEMRLGRSFDRSTVAARFTELKSEAWGAAIVETPETRISPMNRPAHVHKINH